MPPARSLPPGVHPASGCVAQGTPGTALAFTIQPGSQPGQPRYATLTAAATPSAPGRFQRPSFQRSGTAMDEYQKAKFLRDMAQECRMHAAMAMSAERRQRWHDLAQDYERQADQFEAIEVTSTSGPTSVLAFGRIGSR